MYRNSIQMGPHVPLRAVSPTANLPFLAPPPIDSQSGKHLVKFALSRQHLIVACVIVSQEGRPATEGLPCNR
jgi:hypothetical protein